MRIALIACAVFERELSYEIALSKNIVRVWWLRQGLHDTPDLLRMQLQKEIDRIEQEQDELALDKRYDAICLGYGLCSNGALGLRAGKLPVVVPRCDDCISMFLGSAARYRQLFAEKPGCYWYNPGWIEHAFTPSEESYAARRAQYAEDYGEDNADFLLEAERSWVDNYKNCVYIDSPVYHDDEYIAYTQKAAQDFGWTFSREPGDQSMLKSLLAGDWDDEVFLVCPPGHVIEADYSDRKIRWGTL